MKRRCFVIAVLFFTLSLQSGYQNTILYVTEGNIFDGLFKEPFEIAYVILEDGKIFGFSIHQAGTVGIGGMFIREYLKSRGYGIRQAVIIVHNHRMRPTFSQSDISVYRELVRMGFSGVFAMYHEPSGKVIIYREKEAN